MQRATAPRRSGWYGAGVPGRRRSALACLGSGLVLVAGLACGGADARARRFVDDRAGIIAPDSEARIAALSRALLEETGIELRTVTLPDLAGGDIFTAAQRLFAELELGDAGGAGRGLLLLVAAVEERVRLAVSYELEELYPDAFVGWVERRQLAPYFEDGLVGEGIEATVELVAGRAFGNRQALEIPPPEPSPGGFRQGGAGAEGRAPLADLDGSDRTPLAGGERPRYGPQPTAELAWRRFLEIQERRVKDPGLGLYTGASRQLLARRPNSDAGQDHLVRLYAGQPYEIRERGDRAAVVFPDDRDHLLAPWFFRRDAAGWRFDGGILPTLIGYNHRNQWRFLATDHPYAFAFADYRIDSKGFAQVPTEVSLGTGTTDPSVSQGGVP